MLFSNDYVILTPLNQFEVTNLIGLNAPIFSYLNISLTNLALLNSIIFNHFNTPVMFVFTR